MNGGLNEMADISKTIFKKVFLMEHLFILTKHELKLVIVGPIDNK